MCSRVSSGDELNQCVIYHGIYFLDKIWILVKGVPNPIETLSLPKFIKLQADMKYIMVSVDAWVGAIVGSVKQRIGGIIQ